MDVAFPRNPTGAFTGTLLFACLLAPALLGIAPSPEAMQRERADALFARTNASRAEHGVKQLVRCPELDRAAERFAGELAAMNVFSHLGTGRSTLAARLAGAHVRFTAAGENLAIAFDAATAHEQLLASRTHRENLLDATYSRVGIGAIALDDKRTIYVEEFAD